MQKNMAWIGVSVVEQGLSFSSLLFRSRFLRYLGMGVLFDDVMTDMTLPTFCA